VRDSVSTIISRRRRRRRRHRADGKWTALVESVGMARGVVSSANH